MGQVGGEPFAEPFVAHAPPVAAVEELVLEPAEEPLHGGVVRRASLGAHGVGQPVLLADADPSGPPVMAPAVAVDHGTFAVPEGGYRVEQHAVGHGRVGASRQPPGDDLAVEAVDDRGQTIL